MTEADVIVVGAGIAGASLAASLTGARLHETIPNFHHTPSRFATLEQAIQADAKNRAAGCRAEYQFRPALALGGLVFVLVGVPVGVWYSRSDYLSAFVACFLPIVFAYYPLMLCGANLAREGKLPPEITVWVGDAVLLVVGGVLTRRLLRS